jgi:hypothetical protein
VVIHLLQANCRRSPDCTTTFLTKALGKAEVILLQEFWTDKHNAHGLWKTTQDANHWFIYDRTIAHEKKLPRVMTTVPKGQTFKVVAVERDMVAVWIRERGNRVMVVNICNPNPDKDKEGPLRSGRALQLIEHQISWVMTGDFNSHHPQWSDREKEKNSHNTLQILNLGVLKIKPGTTTRQADTDNQEHSILDLVIPAPDLADRITEATIADDKMTTGSDHKMLACKIHGVPVAAPITENRWKTRQPKDAKKLERWRNLRFAGVGPQYKE